MLCGHFLVVHGLLWGSCLCCVVIYLMCKTCSAVVASVIYLLCMACSVVVACVMRSFICCAWLALR